ncbi:MAG: DUF2279 domain-containing protein, partial [Bacteroidia bacterium]|nr:DUF2279 domain-containing protein [Bacteroidia bacterium]
HWANAHPSHASRKKSLAIIWILCIITHISSWAQQDSSVYQPKRMRWVVGISATGYAATMGSVYAFWYAKEPRCPFHWFDDQHEWKQVDKLGHAYTAYQQSRIAIQAMKWTGISRKKAVWIGGMYGILMQHPIEYFDGLMCKYGASVADLVANTVGSALVITEELLWQEQRIDLKFSAHLTPYAAQRPDLLGKTFSERILKDYNGQTYWLSFNIYDFLGEKAQKWYPKWLCMSIGYGADGLLGDYQKPLPWIVKQREFRQWYISLDLNLRKVHTKYKVLNHVLHAFNLLKVPFPAVEFSRKGTRVHPLYF